MANEWSLDELYPSFASADFQEDLNFVEDKISEINEWVADNLTAERSKVEQIEEFIELLREFRKKYSLLAKFAQLKLSVNTNNTEAASYAEQLEKKETDLTAAQVAFQRWLGELDD